MRFAYAFVMFLVWAIVLSLIWAFGVNISHDIQVLSTAVVVAGALAGGD